MKAELVYFFLLLGSTIGPVLSNPMLSFNDFPSSFPDPDDEAAAGMLEGRQAEAKLPNLKELQDLDKNYSDSVDAVLPEPEINPGINSIFPDEDLDSFIDSPVVDTRNSDFNEEQYEISLEDAELAVSQVDQSIQIIKSQIAMLEEARANGQDTLYLPEDDANTDIDNFIDDIFSNGATSLDQIAETQDRVDMTVANINEQMNAEPLDADIRPSLISQYESVANALSNQEQSISDMLDIIEMMRGNAEAQATKEPNGAMMVDNYDEANYTDDERLPIWLQAETGANKMEEENSNDLFGPTAASTEETPIVSTPYGEAEEDYEYEISLEEAETSILQINESIQHVESMMAILDVTYENENDDIGNLYDNITDLLEDSLDKTEDTQDRVDDVINFLNIQISVDSQDADPRFELLFQYQKIDLTLTDQWNTLSSLIEKVASTRSIDGSDILDQANEDEESMVYTDDFEINPTDGFDDTKKTMENIDFSQTTDFPATFENDDKDYQSDLGKFLNSVTKKMNVDDVRNMLESLRLFNNTISNEDAETMEEIFDQSLTDEMMNSKSDVDTDTMPFKTDESDMDIPYYEEYPENFGMTGDEEIDDEDYQEDSDADVTDNNEQGVIDYAEISAMLEKMRNLQAIDLNNADKDDQEDKGTSLIEEGNDLNISSQKDAENNTEDDDWLPEGDQNYPEMKEYDDIDDEDTTYSTSSFQNMTREKFFSMLHSKVGYPVGQDDNVDGITDKNSESDAFQTMDNFNESEVPFMKLPNDDNFFPTIQQYPVSSDKNDYYDIDAYPTMASANLAKGGVDETVNPENKDVFESSWSNQNDENENFALNYYIENHRDFTGTVPSFIDDFADLEGIDQTETAADNNGNNFFPNQEDTSSPNTILNKNQDSSSVDILRALFPGLNDSKNAMSALESIFNSDLDMDSLSDYEDYLNKMNTYDYPSATDSPIFNKFLDIKDQEAETTLAMSSTEQDDLKSNEVDNNFKFIFIALIVASMILILAAIGIVLYRRSPRLLITDGVPYSGMENDEQADSMQRQCSKDVFAINV